MKTIENISPLTPVAHLTDEVWSHVNRMLVRKCISEFTHELILQPELAANLSGEWELYSITSDDGKATYFFDAKKGFLDHWHIAPQSIRKEADGKDVRIEAISFILDFKDTLKIPEELLPTYLEEISSTLYGNAYKYVHEKFSSAELIHADFQEVEHAMTEGHPCFVANSGRIGFDATDYPVYAPEADQPFAILWVAGHKDRSHFACVSSLEYTSFIKGELGDELFEIFRSRMIEDGLSPDDYIFIPVHPWQWFNKLVYIFAPDIADKKMYCLGYSQDVYLAQQSIRTLFNISNPGKHYTKMALSILNMGFMRGMSAYYMAGTPEITEWITELFRKDDFLSNGKFTMLGEIASVGYRNLNYESMGRAIPHNKMVAGLWRESPVNLLQPGQQLITMASLLHIDNSGNAFLPELIKASGLSTEEWLQRYFDCYLIPLLHCFFKYEMAFMPHGENMILILENHVPVCGIMKDITEEVVMLSERTVLPENVQRLYGPTPDEIKPLTIFTDVFDCFFRFVSVIFDEYSDDSAADFWQQVAEAIYRYQDSHPEFQDQYEKYDLFVPEFTRSCLNRLQLRNNRQMVDLANPNNNLQFFGTLQNPVAPFKRKSDEYSG